MKSYKKKILKAETHSLLRGLIKKCKETSANQVRQELGHKSHNTILRWMKIGYIPTRSVSAVEKYLVGAV
jgi:uncharacterized membrane protein YukC